MQRKNFFTYLLLSFFSFILLPAQEIEHDGHIYRLTNRKERIVEFCGNIAGKASTHITVPREICFDEIKLTVKSIGPYAFAYNDSLERVTLAEGIDEIKDNAFLYCRNLKHVHLPASLTTVGNYAFYGCAALTRIRVDSPVPPACGASIFTGTDFLQCKLYVPEASVTLYNKASRWEEFFKIVSMDRSKEEWAKETAPERPNHFTLPNAPRRLKGKKPSASRHR